MKNIEIESKYMAESPENLSRVKDIFVSLAEEILRRRRFEMTLHYYDTADFSLFHAGIFLRSMDAAEPYFGPHLCIKDNNMSPEGDAFQRKKLEFPVAAPGLNPADLQRDDAALLLHPIAGRELFEHFKTINRRDDLRGVFDVNGKKVVLECCVDRISFIGADGTILEKNRELEIEFIPSESDPAVTSEEVVALLNEIGGILRQNIPGITPSAGSKAETGYAFFTGNKKGAAPRPQNPRPFEP